MPEPTLNFFDTYTLAAVTEQIIPETFFFRTRYFPTGAEDVFTTDKVLAEYRKGERKMAAFVAPRVGDIPITRKGYSVHELTPAYMGVSAVLTADELKQRGFGESLYATSTAAERAAKLTLSDMEKMDKRLTRREEWMCARTMIENGCTMVEYLDEDTPGETNIVRFYEGENSEHLYTVANPWDSDNGNFRGDVKAMCKMLAKRGLNAVDLVVGSDVAEVILADAEVRELLKHDSGIIIGNKLEEQIAYPGVNRLGVMNFGGHYLNIWVVETTYEDDEGNDVPYFPTNSALVTFPNCGHMMYGAISQIDYGDTEFTTHAGQRIPKFILDQAHDIRKQRLACRPIAAPRDYCPYIYAANVCTASID